MGKFYPSIPEDIQTWMLQQPVWFVASAPLVGKHVNVSPKGNPSRSLRILNPNQICYLDTTGSGCETISHIYENGRVTVMFNSFNSSPRILRLFCRGRVVEKGAKGWDEWIQKIDPTFSEDPEKRMWTMGSVDTKKEQWERITLVGGARAIIILDVFKVQTSCGFGVPILGSKDSGVGEKDESARYWEDRDTMANWLGKRTKDTLTDYWKDNNWRSLDGCPGLRAARKKRGQWLGVEAFIAWWRRVLQQWEAVAVGMFLMTLIFAIFKFLGYAYVVDIRRLWH